MTDLPIPLPREAIEACCSRWGAVELSLFGSVLRDDFGPGSDVDVLVTFAPDARLAISDMAQMADELAAVVGRRVDLVERDAVMASRNWIIRRNILSSARPIYAAAR